MSSDQNKHRNASRQLSLLVDMNNPSSVLEEVKKLYLDMFAKGDLPPLFAVFEDIVSLYHGDLIGYKACDTPYHNLQHTTDVLLAMARLMHGAHVAKACFTETDILLGLVAALMHDTGYVRKNSDAFSNGAQLTTNHVRRSVDFMNTCLSRNGLSQDQISQCEKLILCTDHENSFDEIAFKSNYQVLLGHMIASADLMAQTADRTYLEKLPLLFLEFRESGNVYYESELDLLKDAINFNDHMHVRLENQLGDVKRFLKTHFKVRWNINADLYQEGIDRSIVYLKSIFLTDNYQSHLRRTIKSIS